MLAAMSETRGARSRKLMEVVLLLVTLCKLPQEACSTGVFELELLDLQRLDAAARPAEPTRVFICLKEAFASQLGGPCPFGNGSITLGRPHPSGEWRRNQTQNTDPEGELAIGNETRRRSLGQGQQKQQGSLLTNLVRISFSFRWTVSNWTRRDGWAEVIGSGSAAVDLISTAARMVGRPSLIRPAIGSRPARGCC